MKFGSHLYGTDTPESDIDYKGIFLPSFREILLNRIPKSITFNTKKNSTEKNSSEDIDSEFYSLHYFLKLATEGQTVAIDMLHANPESIIKSSWIWEKLQENRKQFYTRNLQAFIGYARRQASKYGIKGSRLSDAKIVKDYLCCCDPEKRLSVYWDGLPQGEHIHFLGKDPNGKRQYQVCGKIIQETVTVKYAFEIVSRFYESYGQRAKQAERNESIDWKAVSHAVRAAYQIKEILTKKDLTFPLEQSKLLLQIKQGKIDYTTEVAPLLDDLMDEVEILSQKSDLPQKVSQKWVDEFLIELVTSCYYVRGNF